MDLDTLIKLVLASVPDDWSPIPGPTKPQYVGEVIASDQRWLEVHEHHTMHVYRGDVTVSVAFGMPTSSHDDTLHFEGMDFADPVIRGVYADILYNGVPIHRAHLISVDGGRCLLPMPNYEIAPSGGPFGVEAFAHSATTNEVALARLVDALAGSRDFDRYLNQANIIEVPNP